MRKLVLSIAAAGAFAGAMLATAPTIAAPVASPGALNAVAATLDNVHQAAYVCGRWRCWWEPGGPRWDWRAWHGPRWGWHGGWRRW